MNNAVILHGTLSKHEYYSSDYPSLSNSGWFPWIQKQLLIHDIAAATPEIPHAYAPDYEQWCHEVERFDTTEKTILIGHSCGGGFWVRYLSDRPQLKVGKVILVAPWLDPDNTKQNDFFKFEIDPDLAARTKGLTIFHSDNDMGNIHKSVATLREKIKDTEYKEFHNYGHFTFEHMKTTEFPELLKEALS